MSVQEAAHRKVESECLFKNCVLLKTIIDSPAHNAYWSEMHYGGKYFALTNSTILLH